MVRSSHMKQTSHFQLNQYEASDRILHGDFNSDNQKIDAALAAAGNCRVAAGSYTGTGTYGQNNPCSLTFDFKPLLVFLDTGVMDPYNSIPVLYPAVSGKYHGLFPERPRRGRLDGAGRQLVQQGRGKSAECKGPHISLSRHRQITQFPHRMVRVYEMWRTEKEAPLWELPFPGRKPTVGFPTLFDFFFGTTYNSFDSLFSPFSQQEMI